LQHSNHFGRNLIRAGTLIGHKVSDEVTIFPVQAVVISFSLSIYRFPASVFNAPDFWGNVLSVRPTFTNIPVAQGLGLSPKRQYLLKVLSF
jgi:hypothetical protein